MSWQAIKSCHVWQSATATCNSNLQQGVARASNWQLINGASLSEFSRDNEIIYLSSLLSLLSVILSLGARSILSFRFAAICEWLAISIKQRAQQRRLAVCGTHAVGQQQQPTQMSPQGHRRRRSCYTTLQPPYPCPCPRLSWQVKWPQKMSSTNATIYQHCHAATLLLLCCGSGDKWAQRPQSNN